MTDIWVSLEAEYQRQLADAKAKAEAAAAAAAGKQTASFWTTAAWFVAGGLVVYYVLSR